MTTGNSRERMIRETRLLSQAAARLALFDHPTVVWGPPPSLDCRYKFPTYRVASTYPTGREHGSQRLQHAQVPVAPLISVGLLSEKVVQCRV
jgi:hypothetical protein